MSEKLFRKVSLERLSSPEQLDQLMRVTTPKGWLALLALGGLIAVTILWGFFGSIPDKVMGQGILVKTGGVLDIVSLTSGQVTAIYVDVGEVLSKGQIVARVAQPKIIAEINKTRGDLRELRAERDKVARYGTEEIRLQAEYLTKQRADFEIAMGNTRERLKWLKERLANQKQLLQQGLIVKQTFLRTQEEINSAEQEIEKARGQLKQTSIQEHQLKEQRDRDLLAKEQKIGQMERYIAALNDELEESSRVESPYTGRVLEITAMEGKPIERGARILTLELVGEAVKDLEAILYLAPTEGKRVHPGMKVQLAPSTVKQEEHGCMIGMITYVSEFPATPQGIMRSLQNEKLAQTLASGGAPIEMKVDLIPDPNTESGYKWSSPKGPPLKVQSGTICFGTIVVDEKAPISLVIPLLKKHVVGIGQEAAVKGR